MQEWRETAPVPSFCQRTCFEAETLPGGRQKMLLSDLLLRHAAVRPDQPALIDANSSVSYRELAARARRLAGDLLEAGLTPGARVGILAENCVEFLILLAAASLAGVTLVPINTRLHPSEIAVILDDAQVSLCLVGPEIDLSSIEKASPSTRWQKFHANELGKDGASAPSLPDVDGKNPLLLYFTGGTTGIPKGCMITHQNLFAQTTNFVEAIGLSSADRYGFFMPFFHMAAGGMVAAILVIGATAVLLRRGSSRDLLSAIDRDGITRANLPAVVLRDLRESGYLRALPTLKWLGAGNGSEVELIRLMAERVCADVRGWYGQTEATNITAAPRSTAEALKGFGCIGRPAKTAQVRVVNRNLSEAAVGEVGELWTAGPHVMAGYWRHDEETAAVITDGWLRSGDLVRRDADGSLFIVDRVKEVIKSGGESIYPRELEIVLERHPRIAEAAIVGVHHPRWGETPRAVIVLRPGASLDEDAVIAFCRDELAAFKRPTSVIFADRLPRNVAGKVRKDLVRQMWGDQSPNAKRAAAS